MASHAHHLWQLVAFMLAIPGSAAATIAALHKFSPRYSDPQEA